jgi:molybdate transport system substrate-binding protein
MNFMNFLGRFTIIVFSLLLVPGLVGAQGSKEITVSAGASLTNAFQKLGQVFARQHPDIAVVFNFASSGTLLQQLAKGAPVDVFASADQQTMNQAQEKGLIQTGSRRDFATNRLVLVVPASAQKPVRQVQMLTQPAVKRVSLGNPDHVPAGRYAQEALVNLGLWEPLKRKYIFGETVRQVLDYVARGEVDVGFVYATDASLDRDRVKVVQEIKEHRPISYPIALVADSRRTAAAQQFVDFVLSPPGQALLARYGFGPP